MVKSKLLSLCLAFVLALSLAACGSDPVDDMIVEFEKWVVEVEDLGKQDTVTMDDLTNLMKKAQEFGEKNKTLAGGDSKPTEEQNKKLTDLTTRMMTALQQVQAKAMGAPAEVPAEAPAE
ncbi:MAG: hypothetical protein LBV80_03365 [Deltaproteobacteria bacterium]|nr:hypothetical protein [Deltaproteobacteria bacterium]